jgi:hypothetical protein
LSEPEISDERLAEILRARGFDVSKREQSEPVTQEQVKDWIRQELESTAQDEEKPAEQTFAESYRDALDRSRSRWFGEEEPPDAAG